MLISIKRTKLNEAEELWKIQKRSFEEDLAKYKDKTNPGNESLERLKQKIEKSLYFTIYHDDIIIGGVEVRQRSDTHYRLNRIYIEPSFQNKGFGFQTIKLVEKQFPKALVWDLDTPHLSYKNHHLYEKLGYKRVGEQKVSDSLTLVEYLKGQPRGDNK